MTNMKKIFLLLIGAGLMFTACNLHEEPISQLGKEAIFSSESGLETYSWSFYNAIPSGSDQHAIEQNLVDYISPFGMTAFLRKGAYNSENSSGWSWTTLRNINWFIQNCEESTVENSVKNNYLGLARFFRAYFYYEMVRRFGDVPWIDHALDVDETDALMAPRDSREVVMENVWKDLEFAEQNITRTKDNTCSLVTKWVAYAFASRVALFEGTFRKYHNLNLATSAQAWLERSATAAKYVMDNSGYKLHTGNVKTAYRDLFINTDPKTDEIMMAIISSNELSVLHHANWIWTSATYGTAANFIRPFICTFLQEDGTPYTDREGWETETFYEECQNRDARLAQIIRTPGYTREGKKALPEWKAYARLGYQPIKLCVDETYGDEKTLNTNALSLFRYGEVLLNYAEAKAELGTLTDGDWAQTVGALRKRAGITGGTDAKPTKVDQWFQSTYFPKVTDPTILEVRRERACELCLEGFRFDDLRRWACGELLTMSYTGIYVPVIDEPLDMDNDGVPDVIFYTTDEKRKEAQAMPGGKDCQVRLVSADPTSSNVQIHPAPGGGYYLSWDSQEDNVRVFGKKQYLYPIPAMAMVKNPNITQNPGWENNASNDGN
jgi:hypothetical protein